MTATEISLIAASLRFHVGRLLRTAHAAITVTRRHVPKWLGLLITVCLFIPGPLDEALVLVVIAVMVAVKPVMRRDLSAAIAAAWTI